MKILDVGCGLKGKIKGSVGIDKRSAPHVDVVHDLNKIPYPFDDNEFDRVEMSNIIEHLDNPLEVMNEIYRISMNGAVIRVITPHYSSHLSYGDMEHKHHIGYSAFLSLQETGLIKIKRHKLYFTDCFRLAGIGVLANMFPKKWEKYLCFVMPALYIEVFLEVVKKGSGNGLIEKYIY